MKNSIKKHFSIFLLIIFTLSTLMSCVDYFLGHVHVFEQNYDDLRHFTECSCGEITEMTDHNLEWIVDIDPTYTAPGYKHKECIACGYKTDENTVTERLIHEDIARGALIKNNSTMYTKKSFGSQDALMFFLKENKEKINGKFLCINAISIPEENIHIHREDMVKFMFSYEDEWYNIGAEDYEPEYYLNPCVTIAYDLYSEELGSCITDIYGPLISISFIMKFGKISNEEISPNFEFYKYEEKNMNYVIRIFNESECIGEIFYYTNLEINREWIVDYLTKNITVL